MYTDEYDDAYDVPLEYDGELTAAVNTRGWETLPIADRDTKFAFRAATNRLASKAQSVTEFSSWFFWRDEKKLANNRNSYRLPFADVFDDGTVKLVPAAVFSAAAQLSGAHGVSSIPPEQQDLIKATITRIYDKFQTLWNDPRMVPPWDRPPEKSAADEPVIEPDTTTASFGGEEDEMPDEIIAAVNTAGWGSYPIADTSREWDSGAARQRIESWADGDMGKFRKAFLWWDAANAEKLGSYKFPVADVIDGKLTIIPRAVNNADSRLAGSGIPASDKSKIQGILNRIQKRFGGGGDTGESMTSAAAPVMPPADWFQDPMLSAPTKLRVEADGRVYGHLAQWNTCHRGVGNSCVVAPRSITNYAHFKTGTVLTADGTLLPAGNLTYGGGHADTGLGYIAAAAHYDDAGTAVAQVNVGEDAWGIWVAGAMAAGTGDLEAQQLRAHPLSGDWRRTGGNLELVAALAVNTPGFPIEEPQYSITAAGEQISLVAAGIVLEDVLPDVLTADAENTQPDEKELEKANQRVAALELQAMELQAKIDERRARTIIDMKL